jgi:ureidoglycolate lyase
MLKLTLRSGLTTGSSDLGGQILAARRVYHLRSSDGTKLMKPNVSQMNLIDVRPLTVENFRPYGWLLGKAIRLDGSIPAFSNAEIDFWQEHIFDPGTGGETEVLWVNYRNRQRAVYSLEVHRLTQQAIVPLTGEIIHVVASSREAGSLDESSLCAFRVPVGQGICMRPGCWHTTRVDAQEVKCLMLTRRSTTVDLVSHLNGGCSLSESGIAVVAAHALQS